MATLMESDALFDILLDFANYDNGYLNFTNNRRYIQSVSVSNTLFNLQSYSWRDENVLTTDFKNSIFVSFQTDFIIAFNAIRQ